MFTQLLARSPAKRAGAALYQSAVGQARAPAFYLTMGVPDTVEGRFELLTLHVILIIDRLKDEPGPVAAVRQAIFDVYVSNLDGALREMGVGDLAVGKRMRKLGEAFYGRARAFDTAFTALPDTDALQEILDRTAFQDVAAPTADLSQYVLRARADLRSVATAELLGGRMRWTAA